MKQFKYTIDGKEYTVEIEGIEGNVATLSVNGQSYSVEMEQEAEPEKRKWCSANPPLPLMKRKRLPQPT